ncbi:MAG TPA: hypothetical protein VI547_13060 [Anaerolineales bacterium]|nr:hypothetical protein [Anaerolineales bacterium]
MRQTTAHCAQLELVGDRVRAHFDSDLTLAPGQFALARLANTFDPYLRQPLFPSLISESGFAVDLPSTDPALRILSPGNVIDVVGPIGSALPDLPARTRILLIADSDPAVLLPFAARAIDSGGTATLLLSTRYPLDALAPEIELHLGDLPALAAEFAPAADLVFIHTQASLHRPLHQSLTEARAFVPASYAHALMNLPMPCGTGACGACAVKTVRGHRLACLAGPFFRLAELE